MTFRVVFLGSLLIFAAVALMAVFIPAHTWRPPTTIIAHVRTPEEERGRVLFYSNGCNYCHTQYVREWDNHYGDLSAGGDYAYDSPMILGSERTGPDLSHIGRKRSEAWEYRHFRDPRLYSPGSIMPSWEFLPDSSLHALTAYLFSLGDEVAAERMILSPHQYYTARDPQVPTWPAADMSPGWASWTAGGMQEGKELYLGNCATCHGCAGNGLGHYAGTQVVTPANFRAEPFRNMPDDQWFWHVSEGVSGTVMPVWKLKLSPERIWAVIRYVKHIYAQPMMREPDEGQPPEQWRGLLNPLIATPALLDEAKATYTRECMICHGVAGHGDGPYGRGLQPPPADLSATGPLNPQVKNYGDSDYFWRIREGIPWSAMLPWKIDYADDEIWRLVHYVRVFFTRNEKRPPPAAYFLEPRYLGERLPAEADFESGKGLFAANCARCHGLNALGNGWQAATLDPKPTPLATIGRIRRGVPAVYSNPYSRNDAAVATQGETHYNLFCSGCHGDKGRGSFLAPRLTDRKWYYGGGTDNAVFTVVSNGIPGQLMPAHDVLPEDQRWGVITFLRRSGGLPDPMALPETQRKEVGLVR